MLCAAAWLPDRQFHTRTNGPDSPRTGRPQGTHRRSHPPSYLCRPLSHQPPLRRRLLVAYICHLRLGLDSGGCNPRYSQRCSGPSARASSKGEDR